MKNRNVSQTVISKCVVLLSLLLLISCSARAEVIELDTPADDVVIRGGNYGDTNYQSYDSLIVKNVSDLSYARKSYIKFDVSMIAAQIAQATLELTTIYSSGGNNHYDIDIKVYGLNDGVNGEPNWSESTLTWNNAPGNIVNSPENFQNAVLLGTIHVPGNTPAGTTLQLSTSQLVDFLNSDSNNFVTIMLASGTSVNGDVFMATKEHSKYPGPTLIVTTVPEPAMIGMLFCGGLLLRARFERNK